MMKPLLTALVLLPVLLVTTAPTPRPDPVSPLAREAAEKAVVWLLRAQNNDGSWGDNPGSPGEVGNTAIACLALLAHGSTPTRGPHSPVLLRAFEWLGKRTRGYAGGKELDCYTLLHRK